MSVENILYRLKYEVVNKGLSLCNISKLFRYGCIEADEFWEAYRLDTAKEE